MNKKAVWIGVVFALIVLGVIVYSSMNLSAYRVEECVTYNGQTSCRTASGSSKEFARRSAITNACAQIASGVTDSLACENSPQMKETWK